jgi:hypothetical protein
MFNFGPLQAPAVFTPIKFAAGRATEPFRDLEEEKIMGYYAASCVNTFQMFQDNLSITP